MLCPHACTNYYFHSFVPSGVRAWNSLEDRAAGIGSPVFLEQYARKKVDEWIAEVLRLSVFAKSQPQAAYSAFVYGLHYKWTFLCQTLPDMDIHLRPLDLAISDTLLPAIIGRTISTNEREVLALPCRLGGLGLPHPSSFAAQYHSSCEITFPWPT